MNFFNWLMRDVKVIRQIDARLPDGVPVRIMELREGFHVSVGDHKNYPPEAIRGELVLSEILRQWLGV